MLGIKSLQKRLESLERQNAHVAVDEDRLIELALSKCSDHDLDILYELSKLREAGFSEEQISEMMASRQDDIDKTLSNYQKHYESAYVALRQQKYRQQTQRKRERHAIFYNETPETPAEQIDAEPLEPLGNFDDYE
jgi:DNA-binding transcriptional MerR regulator